DDGEILSRVETNVVPAEVRDWLAMTFSRASSSCPVKKVHKEKPKFRSVANAIRAGIMVDKIYRRICCSTGFKVPTKVAAHMKDINEWSFDVFKLNEVSEGHALKFIGHELLQRYDFINKFKINLQKLDHFLTRLEQGYSKYHNPYHNLIHAADVTQTAHHVIHSSGLTTWFSDLEVFSAIVASLIHDFEHTGTTNTFHINTSSDTALLYNDKAVLENHHLSSTFRMMKDDEVNLLSNLKKDDYRELRANMIEIVLSTDMSLHFQQIKTVKHSLNVQETIDKTKALSLIVHCSDISHPAKDWELHHKWTELLMEEFFRQGDQEEQLSLPVSPLCDRRNTLVAESQIGFIDFIVDPSLQVLGDMADRFVYLMNHSDRNVSSTSACNSVSTQPSTTSSTPQSVLNFETTRTTTRAWEACLVINKQKWKERSANGLFAPTACSFQFHRSITFNVCLLLFNLFLTKVLTFVLFNLIACLHQFYCLFTLALLFVSYTWFYLELLNF
ncbi:hypothetical protein HELRODRAFT_62653, partial [Helobdella robusta]|uniref:Phosphodiesterase n=1 Tax=Helobdella robusta TaxID=6412 RepID=T1FX31_HELRO